MIRDDSAAGSDALRHRHGAASAARRGGEAAPKPAARRNPAGWRQGAAGSVRLLAMALNRSIGRGKTIVELLSPAMLASVCK